MAKKQYDDNGDEIVAGAEVAETEAPVRKKKAKPAPVEDEDDDEPVKRKPGRPRKDVAEAPTEEESEEVKPKRRGGKLVAPKPSIVLTGFSDSEKESVLDYAQGVLNARG